MIYKGKVWKTRGKRGKKEGNEGAKGEEMSWDRWLKLRQEVRISQQLLHVLPFEHLHALRFKNGAS